MAEATTKDLQERFPHATPAECRRFHSAFPKEPEKRLQEYLEWRKEHELMLGDEQGQQQQQQHEALSRDNEEDDAYNWEQAAASALAHASKHHDQDVSKDGKARQRSTRVRPGMDRAVQQDRNDVDVDPLCLPRILYSNQSAENQHLCDKQGNRILHVLPARTDLNAASPHTYATAFGLYLEKHLDRRSTDQLTLLLDVRPGTGWANPPVTQLIGFIRHVSQVLHSYFPGRLHQCVIFPVPRIAVVLWNNMMQFCLDPLVRKLIVLVPGAAGRMSPAPTKRLKEYVADEQALNVMEETRLRAFE